MDFAKKWYDYLAMRTATLFVVFYLVIWAPLGQISTFDSSMMTLDQRFGMVEAFWQPNEAAELGIGWERILFYWREIQPVGPEDWNTLHVLEEWLVEAEQHNRTVVGLLKNTAPWASEDGTEAGLPKGLYLPVDDPDNLWANFVRQVAEYYGSRNVHHWIIWNEPEIRPGVFGYEFAGSVSDYYQLLKVAYKVMKDADPEATIHLAGLTWWHDQGYLRRFLDVASADPEGPKNGFFFDVISIHIYFRTETVRTVLNAVKAIQVEYGIDKPLWINETNAPPNKDPMWPVDRPTFDVDLDQQAWFVIQAFALGFASDAERIGIYKLIDIHLPPGGESFGLMRPDFSRRPAFDAYKQATQYIAGFDNVELETSPQYYLVNFERPTGLTRILWTRSVSPTSVLVTATEKTATLVDINGDTRRIKSVDGQYTLNLDGARCEGECYIGGKPIILVEESNLIQRIIRSALPEGSGLKPSVATIEQPAQQGQSDPPAELPQNQNTVDLHPTDVPKADNEADRMPEPITIVPEIAPSRIPSAVIEEQDSATEVLEQDIGVQTNFELVGLVFLGLGLTVSLLLLAKLIRK